jgi:hypothetical protein
MADGVAAGSLLASFGFWPRALQRIAVIGFDLPNRCHKAISLSQKVMLGTKRLS